MKSILRATPYLFVGLILTLIISSPVGISQEVSFLPQGIKKESVLLQLMFVKVQQGIVYCYSGNNKTTGIFVSKDGWILTVGHKVDKDFPGANPIYVKLERTPKSKVYKSTKILPVALEWDLLLFKIDYKPKFYFKRFSAPYLLQENWIFGFRLSSGKVPSSIGYITHNIKLPHLLLTTASTISGNSGSPILSRKGDVLGIIVKGYEFGDGFFISSVIAKKYIKENLD